jgi:predicted O-methyltransferase YrrM
MIRSVLRALLNKIRGRLLLGVARKEDLDRLYDQIAGLLQIQSALAANPILKPLRGWALSPDTMAWILFDLQERIAPTIVEFGSGQSTVILASCLKNKASGRLISFEHDAVYAAGIRRQLEAWGVAEHAEIQILPLIEHEATGPLPRCESYALPDLQDLVVDLALVDGPPERCGPSARFHPLRWAVDRLNNSGAAYLDDTIRRGERGVVNHLAALLPDIAIEELRAEKGLARCTRTGTSRPGKSR